MVDYNVSHVLHLELLLQNIMHLMHLQYTSEYFSMQKEILHLICNRSNSERGSNNTSSITTIITIYYVKI